MMGSTRSAEARFISAMRELQKHKPGTKGFAQVLKRADIFRRLAIIKAKYLRNPLVNVSKAHMIKDIISFYKKEGQRVYAAGELSWSNYSEWVRLMSKKVKSLSERQLIREYEHLFGE